MVLQIVIYNVFHVNMTIFRHICLEQLGPCWMYSHEIWVFFKYLHRKFKIHENLTNTCMIGTLCEHTCTLMIVSHWIFLEWEILQTKVVDKTKIQIFCSITSSKNCAIYEIMWNNKVQLDRPQMTICMAHAHCVLDKYKQTCTTLLIAFLQQLRLHKNASVLYYTYFACLVTYLYCSTSTWPFTLTSSTGKQSITQKRKQSTTQGNNLFSWLAPVSAYASYLLQWLRVRVQEN